MGAEANLNQIGIKLPPAPRPLASYRAAVRSGDLVYIAGQGPFKDGKPTITGKVGESVTVEQATEAARLTCINALAVLHAVTGTLDKVTRVVKATVYVASANDFTQQPKVADGATDLLREIFGLEGLPARVAIGVNVLPMDLPVEMDLVVETT